MRRVLRCAAILLIVAVVSLGTFVPVQAALSITTVNPAIGAVGSNITVSGTTDAANGSTVTISYDGTPVTTTTVTAGGWSKAFPVPASIAGAHDITASIGAEIASSSFTVRPKIAVTQPAGGVNINGSGFGQSEAITINIDTTQGAATATTDASGSFTVTGLTVTAGSHTFEAINADATNDATTTFTVVSHSTIALGKTSGPVGTSVTVNGAGFAANETGITVTFDGSPIGTATRASATGAWTMTFAIPTASGGPHSIDASGNTTASSDVTEQSFNITPSIKINPTSASPGASITVSGTGFAANETGINVTYDGEPIGAPAAAAANGTWNTTFKVPPGSAGTHTIDAFGSSTSIASVPDLTFKVGAGITINKTSGGAGTSVIVTGAGFAANETDIAITYDGNPIGSKLTAGSTGSWTATITIPATPAGAHTISASGPTTAAVTAQFTSTASVSVPPNSLNGPVGSSINLTGSGFAAGEPITILFDNTEIGSAVAGDDGGLTGTFTIPPSTAGSHTVTIKGSTASSNLSFKVTPSLSLDPASGFVGTTVKVSGSGFAGGSTLKFTYDGDPISNVGTVKTDAMGSFIKQISIPVSEAGPHAINVQDAQNNGSSTDFSINTVNLAVPNPVSPADGASVGLTGGAAPDLKWSPIVAENGSITYDIQVDTDPDFPHPILIKTGLSVPHYTLTKTEALDSGTYYWRVRAVDAADNTSDWSQPSQFRSGIISLTLLIILIVVAAVVIALVILLVILPMLRRRRAQRAAEGFAQAPEIIVPEVVSAEYRSVDTEGGRRALPWRLALPQAPAQPRGGRGGRVLSPEDQARLKVIIDFAKSLPLVEPGPNPNWLVDLAENGSGEVASPALYSRLLKGELQVRYEPAWMRHPTFMDLQTLLEGQPILQDLDSFVDSVNHSASEALMLLQDIYRDATAEAGQDILANNGWGFISGVYTDALSWFMGKYLREPSDRDYSVKPGAKVGESPQLFELSGEASTPFPGVLIQAADENAAVQLRALHLKLRRNYRNNDRAREVVGNTTQLDVQRERLINAFNQFNRLNP